MVAIAGTIFPVDCVDENGWVDLTKLMGKSWKIIPSSLREVGHGYTRVESYNAVVGDPACDPRSGGIAGSAHLCRYYDVDEQQFVRNIAPGLSYIRWFGNHPVTNVESARADGVSYRNSVIAKHCMNLKQFVPNSYY